MKKSIIILCALLVFFACEQEIDFYNGEIDFFPVELYENYNTVNTPNLKFRFITTEIFPCCNYNIETSRCTKANVLNVRFEGIQIHRICLTAIGPAETYINLPENVNKLVLINGQRTDSYNILINDGSVLITPISESFTHLRYAKTFRYPENTFAYICGTNLDNKHIFSDFLNILLDSTEVTEYEFNGHGRIPYPDSSSGHWNNNESRFFKYSNESEFDKAGELLRNFTINHISPNDGVSISLISWNNKKYLSWMMD